MTVPGRPVCAPTTRVKLILLKLFVAITLSTSFYMYYMTPSSLSVRFFEFRQVEEQTTQQPSSIRISHTLAPERAKFSKLHISKTSSVDPNQISQWTTQWTTMHPSSTEARDKHGPLYLTATFMGRLGNHLFIYASLLGIARSQNRTAFVRRGTILDKTFQITHVDDSISTEGFITLHKTRYATFEPRLMNLSMDNITLVGGLQVWRYFKNVENDIRREFTFLPPMRREITEALDKFRSEFKGRSLVGVHVRRGDFLLSVNKKKGYGVAKPSYFVKAFDRMKTLLNSSNVTFLVASDDLKWCRKNLNFSDVKILEPGSAVLHFGILANCDHVILSGGTYGWWAAWLADGITIYYEKFLVNGTWLIGGANLQDYYPPHWIAVGD